MHIILVGDKKSKRTEYFTKAAGQPDVFVSVMTMEEFLAESAFGSEENVWVKIDPCTYDNSNIEMMNAYLQKYQRALSELPQERAYHYLNHPQSILELLDKRKCKEKLIKNQIPVTPLLADKVECMEQLHECMKQARCSSVFIKPVLGSGAAGIAAYRWNWNKNQGVLYTSCKKINGIFQNTKKMHKITDKAEIEEMLKMLFALDVIVEKWIPKAQYNRKSYDLRVVYQFGTIDYIVARQSDGPVTNLHLNNQALDYHCLNLSDDILEEIEAICSRSMQLFPGLSYAGIDILLDKNKKQPVIIEMNGQGDCVYQDMYAENCIYETQINTMLSGMKESSKLQ